MSKSNVIWVVEKKERGRWRPCVAVDTDLTRIEAYADEGEALRVSMALGHYSRVRAYTRAVTRVG